MMSENSPASENIGRGAGPIITKIDRATAVIVQ